MSISDYAGLIAAIPDEMYGNTKMTAVRCQRFVQIAEALMGRRLRVVEMMTYKDAIVSAEWSAIPPDFGGERTFQLNDVKLEYRTPDEMDEIETTYEGVPRFYTRIGNRFRYLPAPTTTLTGRLTYYAKIPPLSDASTTNWLLDANPDAYLYASCIAASRFTKSTEDEDRYTALTTAILADIQGENQISGYGGRIAMRARRSY